MPQVDVVWEKHQEGNCAEGCRYCLAEEKAKRSRRNYRGDNRHGEKRKEEKE